MTKDEKTKESGKEKYNIKLSVVIYAPPYINGISKNKKPQKMAILLFNVSSYIKIPLA